ncbi:MAG: hypothetical protein ABSF70_06315 [Terracidiphilus sp.]
MHSTNAQIGAFAEEVSVAKGALHKQIVRNRLQKSSHARQRPFAPDPMKEVGLQGFAERAPNPARSISILEQKLPSPLLQLE